MTLTLNQIQDLYIQKGNQSYSGEAVSQLEHALQCATLAEAAQSSAALITACLLHDLGHLVHTLGEDATLKGMDDHHEHRAIPFLRQLFGPDVTEPIRLHVEAKRYLCSVDRDYWSGLSHTSQHSLELQGGIFSAAAAAAFIAQPYAQDAVQLRIWDDQAKIPALKTAGFEHFLPILVKCISYP